MYTGSAEQTAEQEHLPDARDKRIAELEQQLTQALLIVERLRLEVARLRAEVEEFQRLGKCQAAAFA